MLKLVPCLWAKVGVLMLMSVFMSSNQSISFYELQEKI